MAEAAYQRCYEHFLRNALDYVPRRVDDDCLQELRWLYDRRDLPEARRDLAAWLAKWSGKYPKLTGWVEESIDETLTPAGAGAGLYGALVVKPDDAHCVFSRCRVSVLAKAQCRTIRGELASGRERSRYTLVFGRSAWTSTMMQSCASAAKLRDGRPIL